jgi:hypothetical protein
MDWKENIGKILENENIYRLNYLNENYLENLINDFTNYLNEFNGMQAKFEKLTFITDTNNLFSKTNIRYRLEIFYPKDEFLFGKLSDNKNRRFITDLYFDEIGLHILVFYRKHQGTFFKREGFNNISIKEDSTDKKSLDTILKTLADDFQKRDIYKETICFNDAISENYLINRLIYLYVKHIESIGSFYKK